PQSPACIVTATGQSSFAEINDFPGLAVAAGAGTTFTAHVSLAAKSASSVGKRATFSVREMSGATLVGVSEASVNLSPTGATLTVSRTITKSGDELSVAAYELNAVNGDVFAARDFSLIGGSVSTPTPTGTATPTSTATSTPTPTRSTPTPSQT